VPPFDVIRKWSKPQSFRSQAVAGTFTLTENEMSKRFTGTIPLEDEPWQIGCIVGRSGTGKTSIAKELWPAEYINGFQYEHGSILDDFPEQLSTADITKALCSVGFASPPDWLKTYEQLSQGEKMRVDIARALCLNQDLIVFDEFTSVVDREIAKISALAISHAIRKSQKKFIAVTCHYDVLDWLELDWVFCTDNMNFDKKKGGTPHFLSASRPASLRYGDCLGTITI
jgi:ABC-type glutathione transport system ATPase component